MVEASLIEEANSIEQMISEGAPVIDVPQPHGPPSPSEPPVSGGAAVLQPDTPVVFPEVTQLRPCSALTCRNGHQWQPLVALAKCGHGTSQGWNGCGNPILAIKLVNCPFCNEPTTKIKIRIDVTPPTPYPIPLCIPGSASHAETIFVEVPLKKWKETEEAELEKMAKEQQKEAQDGQGIQK